MLKVWLSRENMLSLQKINEICTGNRAEIINCEAQTLLNVLDTFDFCDEIREIKFTAGQIITLSQIYFWYLQLPKLLVFNRVLQLKLHFYTQ